ncbi:MAG: hypothetical protein EXS00_01155 [Phycisphaerales bacterium]|nr:hypothetical protein [Phycisphaerales bacterium]
MSVRLRLPVFMLSALAALVVGGCNIVVPAAYMLEGPPKLPALYELPERKVVIFVDDRDNSISRLALRAQIGDQAGKLLLENKLVPEVIESRSALNFARRSDKPGKPVSLEAIGKAMGADVLIYVDMRGFALSYDGSTPKPMAAARVRVIDVSNRERLFPSSGDGSVISTSETRPVSPDLYNSTTGRRAIEEGLAMELGETIAEVFYDHERRELGREMGVRVK